MSTPLEVATPVDAIAWQVTVRGRVQGLGVRPAIHRLALECRLSGAVRNTPQGVEVYAQGAAGDLSSFVSRLRSAVPAAARVEAIDICLASWQARSGFVIDQIFRHDKPPPAFGFSGKVSRWIFGHR